MKPPFLICAGMSARGFDFSVREADGCFIGGRDAAETAAASRRAKALAASLGKTDPHLLHDDGDCRADRCRSARPRRRNIATGWTRAPWRGMLESYGVAGNAMTARAQGAFMTQTVVGSPATCARQIEAFLRDCDIDGLMFIYDDYPAGLRVTGQEILPHLRTRFRMTEARKLEPEWIAASRTALVVIDMQVDFGSPDGEMARRGADITRLPGGR